MHGVGLFDWVNPFILLTPAYGLIAIEYFFEGEASPYSYIEFNYEDYDSVYGIGH